MIDIVSTAGIGLEGIAAAFIVVAVRNFEIASLIGVAGIALPGAALGAALHAFRGLGDAVIMAGVIIVLAVLGVLLFAIGGGPSAIAVSGLGLVFICAAEGTRCAMGFTTLGGLR